MPGFMVYVISISSDVECLFYLTTRYALHPKFIVFLFLHLIPQDQKASNIKVMANAICESFRIAPYDLRYFVSLRNKSFKRNNCVFIHHYF